jgi:hypothetical protein
MRFEGSPLAYREGVSPLARKATMKPTGFYKLSSEYLALVRRLGGTYRDNKERPVYCCIQDRDRPEIYWAIPTSDIAHRTPEQLNRIKRYCSFEDRDIRSCYYHIGHTNRPAIYKISNVLPVTEKHIAGEYISQGLHLVLRDKKLIAELERKLSRILFDESRHPDKYEQRMTSVYSFLADEITRTDATRKEQI